MTNTFRKTLVAAIAVGILASVSLVLYSQYRPIPEFDGGFEGGSLPEDKWILDKKGDCEISVGQEVVRDGNYSVRFDAGTGSRCEILPWPYGNFLDSQLREPYGQERWYTFSTFIGENFVANDQNEVIAQWHASRDRWFDEDRGRGPPLALRIQGNNWRLTYGWDSDLVSKPGAKAVHTLWQGAVEPGRWDDWVFRVTWSPTEDALTEVWKNGEKLARYEGRIAYNDIRGTYLKLGVYHSGVPRVLYMDSIRISSSSLGGL